MMTEASGKHAIEMEENYMMAKASSSNQAPSISIRDVTEVVSSIETRLCQKSPIPAKCSIFRVPELLSRHNEKAFTPMLVSIGPFHHGTKKLKTMQKFKLRYLHCLLNRAPTKETTLKCFVEAIGKIEQECRASYEGEVDFVENEFIEMMVVDGCFIIEFCRKASNEVQLDEEDPVFYKAWMLWRISNDLRLLENQLPWCVLDCLFNLTKSPAEQKSLSNLVLSTFKYGWSPRDDNVKHEHVLDCVRNALIETRTVTPKTHVPANTRVMWFPEQIPSVIELVQAGVQFKVGAKLKVGYYNGKLLNVTFNNGVMTIPQRFFWEETEYLFRNIIAFEQCDASKDYEITSYAKLLDDLVNTSQDIDFLKHLGILKIDLSADEVASFFKRLYSDTAVGAFLYSDLYREVNAYYRRRRNRWRAILKRDYFNNPWTSMSVIAAIMILAFSLLQTIYSILAYYQRSY